MLCKLQEQTKNTGLVGVEAAYDVKDAMLSG